MTTLFFIQKNVYGKTLFYPDDKWSTSICQVNGSKTLTETQLKALIQGGFSIKVKVPEALVFTDVTNNVKD